MEIKAVNPQIWNFEVVRGENSWREVAYSARVSGVPPEVGDEEIFKMIVKNDYGSALEHVVTKFDLKMTKGLAPEFLEHRMISHTGYSTRYIKADEGIEKEKPVYEVILPWHLLKLEREDPARQDFWKSISQGIKTYEKLLKEGVPIESARYALPFCQAVGIYHVTINLRSLLNLLGLRLCVRASPEFRCLAAQIYFALLEQLPIARGLIGCRGFMRGVCPEGGVTGVRKGKQHPYYPPCPFKNPKTKVFVPVEEEMGKAKSLFSLSEAVEVQEKIFKKWAAWEG